MDERKHLTPREVDRLLDAVKGARHETRDRCLLLLLFRHGLRVSEACGLKLSQVDVESRVLHVVWLKQGLSTTHPLRGEEIRLVKAWLKERTRMAPPGEAFFVSERRMDRVPENGLRALQKTNALLRANLINPYPFPS